MSKEKRINSWEGFQWSITRITLIFVGWNPWTSTALTLSTSGGIKKFAKEEVCCCIGQVKVHSIKARTV